MNTVNSIDRHFDAIVIGSGPAGSTAVRELTGAGMDVLLLEAGRELTEEDFTPPAHKRLMPMGMDVLARAKRMLGDRQFNQARRSFYSDAAFERLDAERSRVQRSRDDLAARIDADLLAEYERVRAATGGLGAVALYGSRLEGGTVEIGPQELARIAAAPLDAVVHAEDNDVIVVRMEP